MAFKTASRSVVLGLAVLCSVGQALPSLPRQETSAYMSGLLDFLENTDPADLNLTVGIDGVADTSFTTSDLFDPAFRAAHGLADPRVSSANPLLAARGLVEHQKRTYSCGLVTGTILNGAYACHDYLAALGGTTCAVGPETAPTTMCEYEYNGSKAKVWGWGTEGSSVSSTCANVALGLEPILDNCHVNCDDATICTVAGFNFAYGDGNFEIGLAEA